MDIDEYAKLKPKSNGHDTRAIEHLQIMKQAEVKADLLTGEERWDWFLSYLQSFMEDTRLHESMLIENLANEQVVAADDIMHIKLALVQVRERIRVLEAVMMLPKDLKDQGLKARTLEAQLGEA